MIIRFLLFNIFAIFLVANELIKPIPTSIEYNKEMAKIGKALFFDTNLSNDKKISCSSCHKKIFAGADNQKISKGSNNSLGEYNTPSIYNLNFFISYNWIGDKNTIKEQLIKPITSKNELNTSIENIKNYINSNNHLKAQFLKKNGKVNIDTILDSLNEYIKSLITPNSRFDKFLRGKGNALSNSEKIGYAFFIEKGCISCHNGINIGANMLQKVGIFKPTPTYDGLFESTKKVEDIGVYRVPSLRNVTKTTPYFHSGNIENLKDAIYKMGEYQLGILLKESEIDSIIEFLTTLEAEVIND
jgi:cytochrome c peroxidase